jgi:hypothetical protein
VIGDGPGREPRRPDGGLRAQLEREVGLQLGRDSLERAAAFENKANLYQEGKTLIDAFGKRVRVEEYITRPDPATFKFITLNFRDGRLDRGLFEVTANKPLPFDLAQAGNLWFSPEGRKPEFFATKQRWVLSNGVDSIAQIAVDGDSQQVTFVEQPNTNSGNVFSPGVFTVHQTVFGNVYEFINGDSALQQSIWGGLRPQDGQGMMWHMQPVRVDVRRVDNNGLLATYWDYAFRTRDGNVGSTGKMFLETGFSPNPSLAHFVERRAYVDFVDTNNDGILSFREGVESGADFGLGGITVYHDKAARLDGRSLVALPGAGAQNNLAADGDTTIFSDLDNNGLDDQGGLTTIGVAGPDDPGLFPFGQLFAREWAESENFVINDAGKLLDFAAVGTLDDSAGSQQQIHDLYQGLNFERSVTSSLFGGRKIDVVMSPRLLMDAGLVQAAGTRQKLDAPGAN